MNDALGDRMKAQYEDRTRFFLPRRTFTILRIDGKAFHTYTRGLDKPFDKGLTDDLDAAIISMLPELQGSVFAYAQSDEISILLTDFETPSTSAWFDGNLQKMTSVAASIMTAEFNTVRTRRAQTELASLTTTGEAREFGHRFQNAYFDCRAFTVPDRTEVMNYFRWRQQDCVRNSVSMVAQANFSHKELQGKGQSELHELMHSKGINWATDFSDANKNGRLITRESYLTPVPPEALKHNPDVTECIRTRWVSQGAWVFTKDEGALLNMIPDYEAQIPTTA